MVAQMLKCLPAMWETWVRSLGWEDPLEKEMATHSSVLAWRIQWMEEPGGLQSTGSQSRTRLSDFTVFIIILAVLGLHCSMQVSLVVAHGLRSCSVWA